jgi:hypothetical protein
MQQTQSHTTAKSMLIFAMHGPLGPVYLLVIASFACTVRWDVLLKKAGVKKKSVFGMPRSLKTFVGLSFIPMPVLASSAPMEAAFAGAPSSQGKCKEANRGSSAEAPDFEQHSFRKCGKKEDNPDCCL